MFELRQIPGGFIENQGGNKKYFSRETDKLDDPLMNALETQGVLIATKGNTVTVDRRTAFPFPWMKNRERL